MLDDHELQSWRQRLNLSEEAEVMIRQIRSSEPARRVQGRRGNVRGCFPSRKMGHTVQYESLINELSAIYLMEYHEEDLWSIGINRPPSSCDTKPKPEPITVTRILRISSFSGGRAPDGKNGRWKKNCQPWQKRCP